MGIKDRLRNSFLIFQSVKMLAKQLSNKSFDLSFRQKLYCVFHGFTLEKYYLYDLANNKPKKFITDFIKYKIGRINHPYEVILNDKLLFSRIMDKKIVPKIYGFIQNSRLYVNGEEKDMDYMWDLLESHGILMLKKSDDGGGKGIHRIEYKDGLYYEDMKVSCKDEILSSLAADVKYIVSEFAVQGSYSSQVYDQATNSIRIMTMRDKETKAVSIMLAIHKFGTHLSAPMDNIEKGGISCPLDLETGKVVKAMQMTPSGLKWIDKHPDTKVPLIGLQVPHWEKVKSEILQISQSLEMLHYVGWDVVVTDQGIMIIEGNNNPGLGVQFVKPFMEDKKISGFYRSQGVIR